MRTIPAWGWRRVAALVLVFVLCAAPAVAQEAGEGGGGGASTGAIVFDIMVLRPLGALQTLVGLAMFAVAGPLSMPGGSADEAWDVFVSIPYDEAFTRRLGRF